LFFLFDYRTAPSCRRPFYRPPFHHRLLANLLSDGRLFLMQAAIPHLAP
jgi:hypothetical protein